MESSKLLLILMAFSLGLRHGFDLDHLSTIDAITRTVRHNPFLSKMIGILFALGHGLVVTTVSVAIGSGLIGETPAWLEESGNWISIFFLFLFGILTLWNLFFRSAHHPLPIVKLFFLQKWLTHKSSPIFILLIGALFALSFDTFSQVGLFVLSAHSLTGCLFSGILGLVFMLGMMASDGVNGWFVSCLIRRADTTSRLISQSVGILIAVFSFTIGTLNILKFYA
jgi:high-affinity nickel-transport protein